MKEIITMSELELYQYALEAVLDRWSREYGRLNEHPQGSRPITKRNEQKYWKQVKELQAIIVELEKEQG